MLQGAETLVGVDLKSFPTATADACSVVSISAGAVRHYYVIEKRSLHGLARGSVLDGFVP